MQEPEQQPPLREHLMRRNVVNGSKSGAALAIVAAGLETLEKVVAPDSITVGCRLANHLPLLQHASCTLPLALAGASELVVMGATAGAAAGVLKTVFSRRAGRGR